MGKDRMHNGGNWRIAAAIGAVLVVAIIFTAAVPVSAASGSISASYEINYAYQLGENGVIVLSEKPLSTGLYGAHVGMGSNETPFILLAPTNQVVNGSMVYEMFTVASSVSVAQLQWHYEDVDDQTSNPSVDMIEGYWTFNYPSNQTEFRIFTYCIGGTKFNVSNTLLKQWSPSTTVTSQDYYPKLSTTTVIYTASEAEGYLASNASGNPVEYSPLLAEWLNSVDTNTTQTIINSYNQAITNQTETINNTIISSSSSIQEAITQAIENQTNELISYGSDMIVYLPNQQAAELASAQEQLSSAEGAMTDQSQSLFDKASSGMDTALAEVPAFVSGMGTHMAAVTDLATDLMEVLPTEVQAGFVAMPLLSFSLWLIGLKK